MSHIRNVPAAWDEFIDLIDVNPSDYSGAAGKFVRVDSGPDGLEFTDDVLQRSGGTMTGDLTLNADPSNNLHAATKQYVDSVAQGLDIKEAVLVATTGSITLEDEQTIDGVGVVAGDRVLVKDQGSGSPHAANGIYICVDSGAWTRSPDTDEDDEVSAGMFCFVESGTANGDTGWVLTTDNPITVGSTAIEFTQFSGAGTYTAGAGLTLSGGEFEADFEDVDGNILDIGTQDSGTSDKVARADHVHAHGNQIGGTLHADVIAGGADGFMIGADKTKLDLYPGSLTGGGFLMSNSGGTAVEEVHHSSAQGEVLFAGASGVWTALGVGTAGQVLSSGGAAADVTWEDVATTFVGLTDVDEADYTGHGGWLVRVNASPNGLEFVDLTGVPSSSTTGYTLYYNGSVWTESAIIFNDHASAEVGINTQTPNSTLHVNGSYAGKIVTQTGDYDLDTGSNGDINTILHNNTAGDNTITLPTVANSEGRVYHIKKISSDASYKTIIAVTDGQIEGAATFDLDVQYESVTVVCDGSNWWIV